MSGRKLDNLSGREFGNVEVIAFHHMEYYGEIGTSGISYYLCKCKKCGKQGVISRGQITHHTNKTCQHHRGVWYDVRKETTA